MVIKSTKPIPKSDEFELTAKKTKSKYQNELDTASPVALIVDESQLSGQNAVGYTNTDNDPVTASISLYTDTIGTAQIKKYGSIITIPQAPKLITATSISR